MRNKFLQHLAKPAIEMEANDPVKPTNVGVVAAVLPIPAEKAGFTSEKKPEDQNLEISKTTEIGTEPDFDKKQEDYVAQGQEDGLALEHYGAKLRQHQNRQWAMEDIAEIAQSTIDDQPPAEDVMAAAPVEPGISPEAALMVERALNMDELGEPEAASVAIESYNFSRVAATESFTDRVMNKATQNGNAAGKYANKIVATLQNAAQRVGGALKEVSKGLTVVKNDLKDVNTGSVQLEGSAIAKITKAVRGDSSDRDPYEALRGSAANFNKALQLAKGEYSSIQRKLQQAVDSKDADAIYGACNETLTMIKKFEELANTQYADAAFGFGITEVSAQTNLKAIKVQWKDSPASSFSVSGLRGLSISEADQAFKLVDAADRAIHDKQVPRSIGNILVGGLITGIAGHNAGNVFDAATAKVDKSEIPEHKALRNTGGLMAGGELRTAGRIAQRLQQETHDAVWGTVYNLGDAVITNGNAVRKWGVETLSAGRHARSNVQKVAAPSASAAAAA